MKNHRHCSTTRARPAARVCANFHLLHEMGQDIGWDNLSGHKGFALHQRVCDLHLLAVKYPSRVKLLDVFSRKTVRADFSNARHVSAGRAAEIRTYGLDGYWGTY